MKSLAALFAIRTCFSMTVDGTLGGEKKDLQAMYSNAKTAKEEKQKKRK